MSVLEVWACTTNLYLHAQAGIGKTRLLFKVPRSGVSMQSPYLAIANKQSQIMTTAAVEMGSPQPLDRAYHYTPWRRRGREVTGHGQGRQRGRAAQGARANRRAANSAWMRPSLMHSVHEALDRPGGWISSQVSSHGMDGKKVPKLATTPPSTSGQVTCCTPSWSATCVWC